MGLIMEGPKCQADESLVYPLGAKQEGKMIKLDFLEDEPAIGLRPAEEMVQEESQLRGCSSDSKWALPRCSGRHLSLPL